MVWQCSLHHDGSPFYRTPKHPEVGEPIRIRLRVDAAAPIEDVLLRWTPDGEQTFERMALVENLGPAAVYEVLIEAVQPIIGYSFLILSREGVCWLSAAGISDHQPLDATAFRIRTDHRPPRWLGEAVFYQIFPDTFANGDPALNPEALSLSYPGFSPRTHPWGARVADALPFADGFFGGDLIGVTQRLDYLSGLGIDAIYLNPVFQAPSNHRYDVVSYTRVDPRLGGNEALVGLRSALEERGMRYVLDVVPNHCGVLHPWFQKAVADPNAPEAEFFTFTDHPEDYHCWLHFPSLPKLRYDAERLRGLMFTDEDSVFRRWLRRPYQADGWRIDVANMLGRQGFLQMNDALARLIRRVVKETNPEAYLLGEHFFDATDQLQGDMWDGVMNYAGFYVPLMHWLAGFSQFTWHLGPIVSERPYSTEALAATWRSRMAAIPWASALSQLNSLGTHDTDRLTTRLAGDEALERIAIVLQFAFPGVPSIFYGDELRLANVPKYGSRACMDWDAATERAGFHDLYRGLISLRRKHAVFREGGFQILYAAGDVLAFQREHPDGRLLVVANRGSAVFDVLDVRHGAIADGTELREVFSERTVDVVEGRLPIGLGRGAALFLER